MLLWCVVTSAFVVPSVVRLGTWPLHANAIFELSKGQGRELTGEARDILKRNEEVARRITELEKTIEELSDDELRAKLDKDDLITTFAVTREAAWRVLGLRAFDVQMLGGAVMAQGGLVEMATGEGKTLAAVAPVVFQALKKEGALVVTTNDYLARRDADSVGQVARFLGLTVGLVESTMTPEERKAAYQCDITYASNAEVGFDYLRDHLAYTEDEVVQPKKFGYCLVDEADSILIDEARTPLIISEKTKAAAQKYELAKELVEGVLVANTHYTVDLKGQSVLMTDKGYAECSATLGVDDLANPADPWAPFILNALRAKELLLKDRDYLLRDGEVAILDTFSGRVLEGRRWSDGLQQAVEVKEGFPASDQTRPSALVTFQGLFGDISETLAGMTGTAMTDAEELRDVYNLIAVPIPTALPVARNDYDDAVYQTEEAKWRAAASEVARANSKGRPVLVGTTSLEASEDLVQRLKEFGIDAVALNARPDVAKYEATVVANAGRAGAVTVATNMAGRGTDIVLGGDPKFLAQRALEAALLGEKPEVAEEIVSSAVADAREKIGRDLTPDDAAQLAALASEKKGGLQKLRSAARSLREHYTEELAEERARVLELGGLYVIGTERHESRRIDRQLRGRAGRQGDPGTSRFFVSVDDRMFRIFGGDSIKRLMRTFRVGEDLPIEAKTVTEALTKVQVQVEERNTEMRSQQRKFDQVLDDQRRNVYAKRQILLFAADAELEALCAEWTGESAQAVVDSVTRDDGDDDMLQQRLSQFFNDNLDSPSNIDMGDILARVEKARPARSGAKSFAAIALLRLDQLWATHLTNMRDLKDSIQFRAYESVDPFFAYQKEALQLFQAFNKKLQTDTTYSLFQTL